MDVSTMIAKAKTRVARARVSGADVYGHIDACEEGVLIGWAIAPKTLNIPVNVKCVVGDVTIGPALAAGRRPDVLAANYGTEICGFAIDLRPILGSLREERNSGQIIVEVFAGYQTFHKLGTWAIDRWKVEFGIFDDFNGAKVAQMSALCAQTLMRAFGDLTTRQNEMPYLADAVSNGAPAALNEAVGKLVAPTALPHTRRMVQGKDIPISNYVDQQRYRFSVDRAFRFELGDDEVDGYFRWYLSRYMPIRGWRRAPLSNREIAYLNEMSSTPWATRAMSYFLSDDMRLSARDTEEFRVEIAYWWAVAEAPSRFVEDCLVPAFCAQALRGVRRELQGAPFPMTQFLERYVEDHSELEFLDLTRTADRVLLYFYMFICASERPDFLSFLPSRLTSSLMRIDFSTSAGDRKLYQLIHETLRLDPNVLPHTSTPRLAAARFFDLERLRYRTLSSEGHRVLSAVLRPPSGAPSVDVQMIGPVKKASGLGQAARLSTELLKRTGFSVNAFDFGMDNPAPEGYSSRFEHETLKRARVNVIHLNGESVQLAYAYMPDVFDGAHNVGYFYWELDTPAACHYLSMDLLDEIWVSSEYCRQIYSRFTSKPVVNVGMCAEPLGEVPTDEARRYLRDKLDFEDDVFVFLSAFDSFSFVQRKNPIGVIRAFRQAFPSDPKMRLVLKTHNRTLVHDQQQMRIWSAVDDELKKDDRVVLLDETLTYRDLRRLKAGAGCFVSLHRSEGWGFGLIEAMTAGVPVIATAYSGNMDFCREDTCWLVDYDIVPLYPDDYIFVVPGQQWAEPRLESAAAQMRAVFADPEARTRRAAEAREFVATNFSIDAIAARYRARLEELLARPK